MMELFNLSVLVGCFIGIVIMTVLIMRPINRTTSKERRIVKISHFFVGLTLFGILIASIYNNDSIVEIAIDIIFVAIVAFCVDEFFNFVEGEILEKERLQNFAAQLCYFAGREINKNERLKKKIKEMEEKEDIIEEMEDITEEKEGG